MLLLIGSAEATVTVYQNYSDAGVVAVDNSGLVTLQVTSPFMEAKLPIGRSIALSQLNSSAVTPPESPIALVFLATDGAGNTATAVRFVRVVDPCAEQGEVTCQATGNCSLSVGSLVQSCDPEAAALAALLTAGSAPLQQEDPPAPPVPVDTTKPTITLLGDGVIFYTPSGLRGMTTNWPLGVPYVDPGATATDVNVRQEVVPLGGVTTRPTDPAAAIDTRYPTLASSPWLIEYDVSDVSSRGIRIARRAIGSRLL